MRLTDIRRQLSPGRKRPRDDVPAHDRGRAYLIERELERDGHAALLALVADYISQAELHGAMPMSPPADRWLNHLVDSVDDAD